MWLSALSVARNCHTITTVCGFINIYLKTFYSTKNKPSSLRRIIKKHNKHFLYLPYPYLSISPSSVSRSPPLAPPVVWTRRDHGHGGAGGREVLPAGRSYSAEPVQMCDSHLPSLGGICGASSDSPSSGDGFTKQGILSHTAAPPASGSRTRVMAALAVCLLVCLFPHC